MSRAATISEELLAPRLPVVGVIKIGALKPQKVKTKSGAEFQPPMKLDHFRIGKTTRGQDENYVRDEEAHAILGDRPIMLDVRLPFDTRAEVFHAEMTHYQGRTKKTHQCDGVTCVNPETHAERPCDRRAGRDCPCKPYGRLAVMLEAAPTFGGIYFYRTRSWETVAAMQTFLGQLEKEFGSLRGLPCRLELHESEVRYKDGSEMKISTAYRVALVLRASYEETRRALVQHHRANQIARREILQLAAGTVDELDAIDERDAALIAQEFPDDDAPPAAGEKPELGGPGAPKSKLADMNAELVDELVSKLRGLMARAEASKVTLTKEQSDMLASAIAARDTGKLEQSIDWLTKKLPKEPAQQDEAGPEQPSLLES